ncbi:hypothetical protein L950_0227050 [Sphingobacterium sp. IITKGP-BTPF85]|nr:DUF6766 family protein [Sphingobacterium sp. IITKGP-BTPF85]KKX47339.1 hypothetical protein L950_0227050 [Sphingobacterium sp. IITKGP-BTPF85]
MYRNSLSIVFIALFVIAIGAQVYFGWQEHNQELVELGAPSIALTTYLTSGHFFRQLLKISKANFYRWPYMLYLPFRSGRLVPPSQKISKNPKK